MQKSNYQIMQEQMAERFLRYDQEKMTEKFQLACNADYIYITFVNSPYQINRKTGEIQVQKKAEGNWDQTSYNEAMSIYDVLCDSKPDCRLSGKFVSLTGLKGTVFSSGTVGNIFQESVEFFDGKTRELARACERLGGIPERVGDVSFRLEIFPFLPAVFQFWYSDEEFPAMLKFMWDENILDYVHYETIYFMMSHVVKRLEEEIIDNKL